GANWGHKRAPRSAARAAKQRAVGGDQEALVRIDGDAGHPVIVASRAKGVAANHAAHRVEPRDAAWRAANPDGGILGGGDGAHFAAGEAILRGPCPGQLAVRAESLQAAFGADPQSSGAVLIDGLCVAPG